MNRRSAASALPSLSISPLLAQGTAHGDVTAAVSRFLDAFNKGDMKTVYASYAAGDINIVDEFPPHRWNGPNAAHEWAAEYDKHALATGVAEGQRKKHG